MIDAPPPNLWLPEKPAIIRAVEPWKVEVNRKLVDAGISLDKRKTVIQQLDRIAAGRAKLLRANVNELADWVGAPSIAMFMVNQLIGFGASTSGAAVPTLEFINSFTDTATATTYNHTVDLGSWSSDLLIVVTSHGNNASAPLLTSGTVQGETATVHQGVGNSRAAGIMSAHPTAGGSQTISVTHSGAALFNTIGVWRLTGLSSFTPVGSDGVASASNDAKQITITGLTTGDKVIWCATNHSGSAMTMEGDNERYDFSPEASQGVGGADSTASGSSYAPTVTSCRSVCGAGWH